MGTGKLVVFPKWVTWVLMGLWWYGCLYFFSGLNYLLNYLNYYFSLCHTVIEPIMAV